MSNKVAILIDLNCLPVTSNWKDYPQCIQETVLERLYLDARFNGRFDASELVWAFKFYNSALPKSEADKYASEFLDFDQETFEIFEQQVEKQISAIYPAGQVIKTENGTDLHDLSEGLLHVVSVLRWAQDYRSNTVNATQVKSTILSNDVLAIKSESPGESPSNNLDNPNHVETETSMITQAEASRGRNTIYVLTRVPRDETAIQKFLGKSAAAVITSSDILSKWILGKCGYKEIEGERNIQVKFIDSGYFWDSDPDFNNNYQFPFQKMLMRMGHVGCFVPSVKPHDHGRLGFPSWKNIMKEIMLGNVKKKEVVEVFKRKPEILQNPPLCLTKLGTETNVAKVSSRPSSITASSSARKSNVAGMDVLMSGKIKTPYAQDLRIESKTKERRLKTADQYTKRNSTGLDESFNNSSSFNVTSTSRGSRSFLAIQNPKKPILVAQSNKHPRRREEWPSLNFKTVDYAKSAHIIPHCGGTRVTPTKRVRRNLFSSHPNEPGAKNLGFGTGSMTRYGSTAIGSFSSRSASSSNNSFRSPVAGSPGAHYSPFRSPTCSRFMASPLASRVNVSCSGSRVSNGMFSVPDGLLGSPTMISPFTTRTPSSKRRVTIDESPRKNTAMESPDGYVHVPGFHGVICPESPATPPQKKFKTSSIISSSSCEKREFVPESPECAVERYNSESFATLRNMSFYKRGESSKSQSWVAAEKKIRAARLKDSVRLSSLHSQTLSLSLEDLDFLSSPPKSTSSQPTNHGTSSSLPPQTPVKMEIQGST